MRLNDQIPSLDGLRAVSIALVFLSHAGFSGIAPGGFGVTVFFFLSGFLITTLLMKEWDSFGSVGLSAFYIRRFVRLAPPIVIVLSTSVLLLKLNIAEGKFDHLTLLSQLLFFYNYFVIYGHDPGTVDGLGVLWSLSVEEHFYLIWPALFILYCRRLIPATVFIALLAAILGWRCVCFYYFGADAQSIIIRTDTRFDSLLYGCLLALGNWSGICQRIFTSNRISLFAPLSLFALATTFLVGNEAFRMTLRFSLQGIILMPIFFYAVSMPRYFLFLPLNLRFVRAIGQWSYTIYLIHGVVLQALQYNRVARSGSLSIVVLGAFLSIAYAAAVFYAVERPLRSVRKKITGHTSASVHPRADLPNL